MWKVDLESVINLESVSKLAYASKSQLISKGLFDDTKKSFWNYMTFTDLSTNVLSCFSWNIESLHEQYNFFWTFGLSKLGATWGTTLAATWPFDCVIFGYWETWLTLSMLNRRPVPSTDQAIPSCFYFKISWILMEQRCF